MAFGDIFKKKELAEISRLNEQLSEAHKKIEELSRYQCILDLKEEQRKIKKEIEAQRADLNMELTQISYEICRQKDELGLLKQQIKQKKSEIVELDNEILLQDFGLYSPIYDFASSDLYKEALDEVREKQKKMVKTHTAAVCDRVWTVDGSLSKGQAMSEQNIKQIIRCFNDECDVLIDKVKFNNVTAFEDKINRSFNALNRMNTKNAVRITDRYLKAKIDELHIAYEYALKKQKEKEEQKRIREQQREEAKLLKELEEARKDIEKERKHYTNALSKILNQLSTCDDAERQVLEDKRQEIEGHLSQLESAMADIDYREANKRAGYVYVISNIGSFGENIYKIGMTRRLDPMERVDELGDASVPFRFDVHAMIFSDDAPALEAALHRAFDSKKVNMVNGRREFFAVTLDEIEDVVKANYDKTVEFTRVPNAEQYRESVRIRNLVSNSTQQPESDEISATPNCNPAINSGDFL